MLHIHGFHADIGTLKNLLTAQQLANLPPFHSFKQKLLTKQKGFCPKCTQRISLEDPDTAIHHVVPLHKGGSKNKPSNLTLVHRECHALIHKNDTSESETTKPPRPKP
jgi:5-methylcytosine-specific restriction endonuclease McrA